MSGYKYCSCRDCFETVIANDEFKLCDACQDAGCDGTGECQSPTAYGCDELEPDPHGSGGCEPFDHYFDR